MFIKIVYDSYEMKCENEDEKSEEKEKKGVDNNNKKVQGFETLNRVMSQCSMSNKQLMDENENNPLHK